MTINVYDLANITEEDKKVLFKRGGERVRQAKDTVRPIVEAVKTRGIDAVIEFTEKFDGVKLTAETIKVTPDEVRRAASRVPDDLKRAIEVSAKNIRRFHEVQMPEPIWLAEIDKGVMAGEKITPMDSVGLYVPRGKGTFSQIVLRVGIPAIVAGVGEVVICTPPTREGYVDDSTIYAADYIGIKSVYKAGGAQAIAALGYGAGVIPKVHKIVGPGNEYVIGAKELLYGETDVGTPTGISESIILADDSCDPYNVALSWLVEAEHGPFSPALLVTHSRQLAEAAAKIIPELIENLTPDGQKYARTSLATYGGMVLTSSLDEAIDFVNEYAPEHIEVMIDDPMSVLCRIRHAGEILLGKYAPICIGNYTLGPSAVLPTGRAALTCSGISVFDFLKRTSLGYLTKEGFLNVREATGVYALHSELVAHSIAVTKRKI